jgi:hypothetical protein
VGRPPSGWRSEADASPVWEAEASSTPQELHISGLWQQLSGGSPQQLPLLDYHSYPERSQARFEVIQLYFQGWSKTSVSRFLHVSRPTVNTWIGCIKRDNSASLEAKSSAPKIPARKAWLLVMLEIYHLQKHAARAADGRRQSRRNRMASRRRVQSMPALCNS